MRAPLRSPETRELLRARARLDVGPGLVAVVDIFVRSIIQSRFGDAEAGEWYALLLLSSQFIGVIAGSLSYFTGPLLARIKETGDFVQTSRVLNDSLRLTFVVMFPLLVAIALCRDPLVDVLFSSSFDPIVADLPIMLAGDGVRLVAWTLGVALVPLGLTRAWVAIAIAGLLGYAGFAYLTVDDLGRDGGSARLGCPVERVRHRDGSRADGSREHGCPRHAALISFALGASVRLAIASLVPVAVGGSAGRSSVRRDDLGRHDVDRAARQRRTCRSAVSVTSASACLANPHASASGSRFVTGIWKKISPPRTNPQCRPRAPRRRAPSFARATPREQHTTRHEGRAAVGANTVGDAEEDGVCASRRRQRLLADAVPERGAV